MFCGRTCSCHQFWFNLSESTDLKGRIRFRRHWDSLSQRRAIFALGLTISVFSTALYSPVSASGRFLALGTAYRGGTYYPVGNALCDRVNSVRDKTSIRCLSYETGGSSYNIEALRTGELDLAITQSNLAYSAYHGVNAFEELGSFSDLRTVINLYDQPLTISVHKDSGIDNFTKMPGRIVNIGNRGSGKRTMSEKLFGIMGWTENSFSKVLQLPTAQQVRAFCDRDIDIMIETVGIPTPLYKTVEKCGGIFLDLPDSVRDGFRKMGPFFFDYSIPRSVNINNTTEVRTTGLKISLVTRADVPATVIRSVVGTLISDLASFRRLHRALSFSSLSSLTDQGIHVPLHDGVTQYLASLRPAGAGGRRE